MYILGKKFGADPKTEAGTLLEKAKSLGLNVIGVAFHIGSGSKDFTVYREAIACAKKIFDLGSNLGFNFNLLDVGGGFPGHNDNAIFEVSMRIYRNQNILSVYLYIFFSAFHI